MHGNKVPITNSNLEFRKIKSLQFLYEVNSNGTILRNVKSKKQSKIFLDYHHSINGYYMTFVNIKKKVIRVPIARVVAECWLGDKPNGYEIDHIDRNAHNNDYRNLRYVTKSEQMKNRDHSKIIKQGKINLAAWQEQCKKPVKLIRNDVELVFESIIATARYLASYYNKPVEHMRNKLKKRRSQIYDYQIRYQVVFWNAETLRDRSTEQEKVHK